MRDFEEVEWAGTTLWVPPHRARREPWHEAQRLTCMKTFMAKDPGLVIDVGAEEGDFAVLYMRWGCEVFLVEANPKAWPWIDALIEENRMESKVEGFYRGFVGSHPSGGSNYPEDLDLLDVAHGQAHLWEEKDPPVTTIDNLAQSFSVPPKYITVDVEGAEMLVLRGAEITLIEGRPIVFCSIHAEFSRQLYGTTDGDLFLFMGAMGYRATHICTDHEAHWLFTPKELMWERG